MKRCLSVFLVFSMLFSLCAFGMFNKKLEGRYDIIAYSDKDWDMDLAEIGAKASSIYIAGLDQNVYSTAAIVRDEAVTAVTGYVVTDEKVDGGIRYKFRVKDYLGEAFGEEPEFFFFVYDSKNDEITLDLGEDTIMRFGKVNYEKPVIAAMETMAAAIIEKSQAESFGGAALSDHFDDNTYTLTLSVAEGDEESASLYHFGKTSTTQGVGYV